MTHTCQVHQTWQIPSSILGLFSRFKMKEATDIKQRLTELNPLLSEKFGVKKIGIFGSYALGNQLESSDVDILVELEEPLGWAFFDLKDFLEQKLDRPVDLVTRSALKKQLKDEILNQTTFL